MGKVWSLDFQGIELFFGLSPFTVIVAHGGFALGFPILKMYFTGKGDNSSCFFVFMGFREDFPY